ncbi:MAG: hypothetical protein R2827_15205 [Bdellovibrionales bacterium]
MKYIIAGTNRPDSRSLRLSYYVQNIYNDLGEEVEIISLDQVGLDGLHPPQFGGVEKIQSELVQAVQK